MSHLMRADGWNCPPAHPSISCYCCRSSPLYFKTFHVGSFSLCVLVFMEVSINRKLTFQPGGGIFLPLPKTSLFPFLQVFPTVPGFLLLAWQRLCQGLKYIWRGVRDGAPFQDLPLWLRIRAFSSALNNSCTESICLVRFVLSSTWWRGWIGSSQHSSQSSSGTEFEIQFESGDVWSENINFNLCKLRIDLEREIVLGRKKKSIIQEVFFVTCQNCNERSRGEVEDELGREGLFRLPPLFIPDALSVPLLSLRDLTHWNPAKALRQQHRQTERGESRHTEREEETKQRWDKTLVLLSAPFFLSVSASGCYPNLH